jgi:hypothetical protein
MGDGVTVQGLTEVEIALDQATSRMLPEVVAVLGKAGLNIKSGTQRRWSGMAHLRRLPSLVSYDVWFVPGGIKVEIGPQHVGQGELANVAEFGTVNNAPRPALAPELDLEEPKTEAALAALVDKLL